MAEAGAHGGGVTGAEGLQSYAERRDMASTDIAHIPVMSLAGVNLTTVV